MLTNFNFKKTNISINIYHLHLNLSISFPAHSVAKATLIENTLILPTLSLKSNQLIIQFTNIDMN